MKKNKKNSIIKQNTEKIETKIGKLDCNNIDENLKKNLSNYVSDALRITDYYGNLRIKYVGFNFTFIAFFSSILAIFIAVFANFYPALLYIILPLIIGFALYLIDFLRLLIKKDDTISFKHSDLRHYSSITYFKGYPEITDQNLDNFVNLIKKKEDENNSIKNNLKTLILQYFYQTNYQRAGKKMRNCLILGSIFLFSTISLSFIWLIFVSFKS